MGWLKDNLDEMHLYVNKSELLVKRYYMGDIMDWWNICY